MQKARKRATKQVSDSEISDDEFNISGLGFTDSEDDDFDMMSDEEESEDDDSGDESEDSRKMNYNDDDEEEEEEYDFEGDGFVDDVHEEDYDEEDEDVVDLETFAFEDERIDDSTGLFMDDLEDDLDEDSDFLVDDDDGIDAIVQDVLMGKRQELRNMIVQGVPFGAPLTGERDQQTQKQKKQKQQQLDVASTTTTTTTTTKKSQTTKESDAKKKRRTRDAEEAYALVIEPRTGRSPKKSYRQTTIGDTLSAAASREDIIPVSRMMGEPHNSAWPIFGLINTMGSVASRSAEFISLLCQLTAEVRQDAPAIQPEKTVQQREGERKKRRRSSSDKPAAIQKHKRHRTLESYLKAK